MSTLVNLVTLTAAVVSHERALVAVLVGLLLIDSACSELDRRNSTCEFVCLWLKLGVSVYLLIKRVMQRKSSRITTSSSSSAPRLDPTTPGMHFVRMVSTTERATLERAYTVALPLINSQMEADIKRGRGKQLHWMNLYSSQRWHPTVPAQLREDLWSVAQRFTRESRVYSDPICIISISFVVNPASNAHLQKFHVDYRNSCSNMFVPITPSTPLNATQYVDFGVPDSQVDRDGYLIPSWDELLQDRDTIQLHQLLVKPWSLLQVPRGTVHRGMANNGEGARDRILFTCTYDTRYVDIKEKDGEGYHDDDPSL